MTKKKNEQTVGRPEPEFKIDIFTFLFAAIGFVISWVNMILIFNASPEYEILAFLSIILTTMIPGVIIAIKNRYWGYGYLIGFCIAGIPFSLMIDGFIGGYTFFTTIFIFIILWLIFWKTWRTLSAIKTQ
ncbi:MAG: hypothetical protein EAX89_07695 [Candidatus Lokiarchaeota archaeon]|nr:hypothetical protein [Candidatus Lokiarchaeota archaeon]